MKNTVIKTDSGRIKYRGGMSLSVNNPYKSYIDYKYQISDNLVYFEIKRRRNLNSKVKGHDEDIGIFENPLWIILSMPIVYFVLSTNAEGMRKHFM